MVKKFKLLLGEKKMKYFSIEGKTTGKQSWFTVKIFIFKISISTLGIKKFSLRFSIEYGWDN